MQSHIPDTQAYVCPKILAELIGNTEIAFTGPDTEPKLYLLNHAPTQDHIERKTILFCSRQPQEILEDKSYIQVAPLPEDSPELPKYQLLLDLWTSFVSVRTRTPNEAQVAGRTQDFCC